MHTELKYDLRGIGPGKLDYFFFSRPDPERKGGDPIWIKDQFDPFEMISYYTRLFRNPAYLLSNYTTEKLECGFWRIIGPGLDCSVSNVIWIDVVPFETRARCIHSMEHLFAKFFSIEPLESAGFMWWDALDFQFHCDCFDPDRAGESSLIQNVMFETLVSILNLPNSHCQLAALHGLGHLRHPHTVPMIQAFLKKVGESDKDLVNYANSAAAFKVL